MIQREIQAGDIVMDIAYMRILQVDPPLDVVGYRRNVMQAILVENVYSQVQFYVRGKDLIDAFVSADRVTRIERVSKTEMAERFVTAGHLPFTVEFVKANHEKRTLRGRLISTEHLLGRSLCHDFDAAPDDRIRLVDHRTLIRLIVNGVEYTIKK